MKFANFLFFQSYKLAIHLGNEGFYPEINAWFLSTLLPWFNVLSILIILKRTQIVSGGIFNLLVYSTLVFWVFTFYFYIVRKQYKQVILAHEKVSSNISMRNFIFYVYMLATGIIYFIFLGD